MKDSESEDIHEWLVIFSCKHQIQLQERHSHVLQKNNFLKKYAILLKVFRFETLCRDSFLL